MTTLSYATLGNLVAGHQADINDVVDCFTKVSTWANGNVDATNLATSAKPATLMGAYRMVAESGGFWTPVAAGTYMFTRIGTITPSGSNATLTQQVFALNSGDYAVSGLSVRGRLRVAAAFNATAPAITFTFGLYPVTVAGSVGSIAFTLGTVTTSSTVAFASPSASTATTGYSSDFSLPSAGVYALGFVTTGTGTANSVGEFSAALDVRQI